MTDQGTILVVDDEEDMLENCSRILSRAGYRVRTASDPDRALGLMEEERPDIVLTDLMMPKRDGMDILRRARAEDPDAVVILITAYATIESAVVAIKEGAFDYLPKPFSADQLRLTCGRALRQRRLLEENRRLREQLEVTYRFENIVGQSPQMAAVFELVRKVARSDANVLIQGESGTGKELIARAIHANSPRATQAFIPVDCVALPENLLESELYGHEKGAFTGAIRTKSGIFETAHWGTIFLDEIGDLSLNLQAKLLRTLQERQFRRVGGTRLLDVDVRVISATNKDLGETIKKREFREELYYRINVIPILLPPLRDRAGDARLLAYYFLKKYAKFRQEPLEGFTPETLAMLEAYSWPGNVRELQNVIERACALADGSVILPQDLPDQVRQRPQRPSFTLPGRDLPMKDAKREWIRAFEREYLIDLLRRHSGNISQAAKTAGIDRKTIHRLITKYQIKQAEE